MSNINLTNLYADDQYKATYKDMSLDLRPETKTLPRGLYRADNVVDIKESNDEAAIQNSLFNIFNTSPGQKLLNPEFGLDLKRYLFDPLTQDIAQNIGESILQGLNRWEPRVIVTGVNVITDFDQNQYIISLYIEIPTLNITQATYNGALNTEGFTFKISNDQ
jgi:phage baseplate assembly protein W